jgi:uncharacterized membrane protein
MSAAAFVPGRSDWLLFAHVAAAFVFFGAAITVTVVSVAATRARRAHEVALLARLAHRVNTLLLWPALVILVGAGAQLASSEDAYGRGWLRFGIILTAIVALVGGGVEGWLNRRRMRVAERAAAEGAEFTEELERLTRSPVLTMVGTISLILLVIVFWLMTAKPGIYE